MAKRNYINNVTQKSQIKKKIIKWSYLTLLNSRTDPHRQKLKQE